MFASFIGEKTVDGDKPSIVRIECEPDRMASFDHEHFGRLRYREEEGWIGQIHLSRFAECRDAEFEENLEAAEKTTADESVDRLREKTRQTRRQQQLAEGRIQLVICASEPKETPCPHCKKPLASPAAKQCLHCEADWHRSSTDA
jgi:hypothetical protein